MIDSVKAPFASDLDRLPRGRLLRVVLGGDGANDLAGEAAAELPELALLLADSEIHSSLRIRFSGRRGDVHASRLTGQSTAGKSTPGPGRKRRSPGPRPADMFRSVRQYWRRRLAVFGGLAVVAAAIGAGTYFLIDSLEGSES